MMDFIINAFRLYSPISLKMFGERTGLSKTMIRPFLQRAKEASFIVFDDQTMSATKLGKKFFNQLLALTSSES
jgi:coproporphyrinogen III oxidase-like Fe-S oxidoreductase